MSKRLETLLKKYRKSDAFVEDLVVCLAEEILKLKDKAYGVKFYNITLDDTMSRDNLKQLYKEKCIDRDTRLLLYLTESQYTSPSFAHNYTVMMADRVIVTFNNGLQQIVKCRWGESGKYLD
jgi:hypothetical protein